MKNWIASVVLLFVSGLADAALPREVSGGWYNPGQSGHGVTVEIASPTGAIVYWMVYDTQGAPMPLYIEGRIVGRRIEGTAYAPRGMRFGSFDPRDVTLASWGEVDLDFGSCTTATLSWNAIDPAFGEGYIPLQRLIGLPLGSCEFPASGFPFGALDGELNSPEGSGRLSGAVGNDGVLYATTTIPDSRNPSDPPIDWMARIVVGVPTHGANGVVIYDAEVLPNGFLCALRGVPCPAPRETLAITATRVSSTEVRARAPANGSVFRATIGGSHYQPSGSFLIPYRFDIERAGDRAGLIEFGRDRSICIRLNQVNSPCFFRGRYVETDQGPYAFELARVDSNDRPFRGVIRVGFNEIFIGPLRFQFIGSDGKTGLAFAAS